MLVRHSISLTMGRNPSIRRMVNEIEDLIKAESIGGFAQPQLIPVPDELDPEIPRVVFTSKGGHTQVMVSQVSVTFNANYSPDWAQNPEGCRDYLLSKVDLLFKIVSIGWRGGAPNFAGISTAFRIPADTREQSVSMLAQVFRDSGRFGDSATELSCRWSLSEGQQFFNNVALQTFITLDEQYLMQVDGVPRINADTINSCGVEVLSDFNDRLAFNERPQYSTNTETVKEMLAAGYKSAREAVETLRQG